jgi:hypothetical protein
MKTLFSVLAAAAVLGFAAPSNAKADCQGETRIVGYSSYGTPVVAVYQIVGYDGYGRPIGQWVTQPQQSGYGYGYNAPRQVYVQPNINLGFGINSGYNGGYQHGYSHHHHGFCR